MKSLTIFVLYFFLGIFLTFSFRTVHQTINSQQLKTPLASSPFSLNDAPRESLRGTIISLSGDVYYQSRIATQGAKITKPMQIQQGEEIVTKETGKASIIISNVVNLTIYPKTEINFIQTLPSNILIEQKNGSVEYRKIGNNFLSVRSQSLLIKINQGDVRIWVNENQPYITVDVKDGSITAGYNNLNYFTRVIDVTSGNRLIFQTDTKRAELVSL